MITIYIAFMYIIMYKYNTIMTTHNTLFVSSMSKNFLEILTASAQRAQPMAISPGNPKPGQGLEVGNITVRFRLQSG